MHMDIRSRSMLIHTHKNALTLTITTEDHSEISQLAEKDRKPSLPGYKQRAAGTRTPHTSPREGAGTP